MATTSLWKIQNRIDKVINYTTNPEKTENIEMYKALHNTIEYATSNYKTEKQYYVTGINCSTTDSVQDMLQTKKHFGKEKGIVAYHGFQSFAEGEVTAKQAHEIGVRLAEELWGDKYEVLVSTHLNTKHYHNHFVVNSVSYVDGKKYRNTRENYAMMRKISDELCKEYGLSVIEEKPCGKHNIDYTKYYNSYIQKSDYYTTTKDDVDFAIAQAYSYKNFESILKKMGYTITIRANKISLVRPPYKRNIRIERSFGEEYSINNITERIMNTETTRIPFPEKYRESKIYTSRSKPKVFSIDRGSLYKLYLYYCYMLKVFPKSTKTRYRLTPEQRAEADAKCKALSDADTVKTKVERNDSPSVEYKKAFGKDSIPAGKDIDHTIDLQLGGNPDVKVNGKPLDKSVNRSLGKQIGYLIKDFDYGTIIRKFTMVNRQ